MGAVPPREHTCAPDCPESDSIPFPTEDEHLRNDNELQQLLLQLRPAEMLIAYDAALCLLQRVYARVPLSDPDRGGVLRHMTPRQVAAYKAETLDIIDRIRARFLHPGSGEEWVVPNDPFPPYRLLPFYEIEMGALQRAALAGKPKVKTRAEAFTANHPADILRMVFPVVSQIELGLPRIRGGVYEDDIARHQWRAVRWLLNEIQRRLAYQRIRKMDVQGPPTTRTSVTREGEGGVRRPAPYPHLHTMRVEAAGGDCPSEAQLETLGAWHAVRRRGAESVVEHILGVLARLHDPRAKWLAVMTLVDMAEQRIFPPQEGPHPEVIGALRTLRDDLRARVAATPAWPPNWPVPVEDRNRIRDVVLLAQAQTRMALWHAVVGMTDLLASPLGSRSERDTTYDVALGLRALAYALGAKTVELEAQRYGVTPHEESELELASYYLACWEKRVLERLAFRDASTAELEGEIVAGPRARGNWGQTYTAQVVHRQTPWGMVRHLKVHRRDGKPVTAGWDVLQRIKNDMLGEDTTAIEIFPAEADVVEEVNYRHFFEVPHPETIPSLRR